MNTTTTTIAPQVKDKKQELINALFEKNKKEHRTPGCTSGDCVAGIGGIF